MIPSSNFQRGLCPWPRRCRELVPIRVEKADCLLAGPFSYPSFGLDISDAAERYNDPNSPKSHKTWQFMNPWTTRKVVCGWDSKSCKEVLQEIKILQWNTEGMMVNQCEGNKILNSNWAVREKETRECQEGGYPTAPWAMKVRRIGMETWTYSNSEGKKNENVSKECKNLKDRALWEGKHEDKDDGKRNEQIL